MATVLLLLLAAQVFADDNVELVQTKLRDNADVDEHSSAPSDDPTYTLYKGACWDPIDGGGEVLGVNTEEECMKICSLSQRCVGVSFGGSYDERFCYKASFNDSPQLDKPCKRGGEWDAYKKDAVEQLPEGSNEYNAVAVALDVPADALGHGSYHSGTLADYSEAVTPTKARETNVAGIVQGGGSAGASTYIRSWTDAPDTSAITKWTYSNQNLWSTKDASEQNVVAKIEKPMACPSTPPTTCSSFTSCQCIDAGKFYFYKCDGLWCNVQCSGCHKADVDAAIVV